MIMKTKREQQTFLMSKMHLCSPSGNDRMIAISKKTETSFNTIIGSLLITFDVTIFFESFPRPKSKLATRTKLNKLNKLLNNNFLKNLI